MSSPSKLSVEQTVGDLSGKMTGIEAQTIGDIYVEKLLQLQIVSFHSPELGKSVKLSKNPYVSLYPYTAKDAPLFRGRDEEISSIVARMRQQQLLVLYGHAGVGKTSLLSAGVIPALGRAGAAFAIQIQDYKDPSGMIFEGLSSAEDKFSFDLPKENKLPMLLSRIIAGIKGTLVLVLDQFELLFESTISEDRRNDFITSLAQALRDEKDKLRVIISVRSESLEKIGEIEKRFERLLESLYQLLPMTRDKARLAIDAPGVNFEPKLIDEQLLPDLAALTEDDQGFIHPQYLQIVCSELYRKLKPEGPNFITSELYAQELKGAEAIMASFMRRMIQAHVKDNEQGLAFQLLAVMASPGAAHWIRPSQFDLKDIDEAEMEAVLDDLVKAKLLIKSEDDGKIYSLVSQFVAREFRRISGTGEQVEQRYNAEDELERIWRGWLSLEHYASREQLRYLTESGGHLHPRAVKTLLMLRSAAELDAETGTWLSRLRGDEEAGRDEAYKEGRQLIEQLEMNSGSATGQKVGRAMLLNARRLLGFTEDELSNSSVNSLPAQMRKNPSCGVVARTAVSARSSAVRQTCALALAAVDSNFAIMRLKTALRDVVRGSRRRRVLRSELFGTLADADPNIADLNRELPLLQRMFIGDWRARRRIARDSRRLAWLTLGGAIGAGLGVGIWRAISAAKALLPAGQEFGIYFFFAGTLGAAVTYGTALAKPLRSEQLDVAHNWSWRSTSLSVALGTVFFGLTHLVLAALNGLALDAGASYYVILMGFTLGLGLSLALSIPVSSELSWTSQLFALTFRLVVAAFTFVLVGEVFRLLRDNTGNDVLETVITRGISSFEAILAVSGPNGLWRLTLANGLSTNAHTLATVHGILTGASMVMGLTLGSKWAERSMSKKTRRTKNL